MCFNPPEVIKVEELTVNRGEVTPLTLYFSNTVSMLVFMGHSVAKKMEDWFGFILTRKKYYCILKLSPHPVCQDR